MERDERIANASSAIVKLAGELVAGKIAPLAVANEIGVALGQFLSKHFTPTQAAAIMREQAAKIDPPDRQRMIPDERELLDLDDKAQQFINTLQIAGIEEPTAVTALTNACILRVARTKGAAGA